MSKTKLLTTSYALLLFVSAFLLFLIQPLVGKMLLPFFGGVSSVWNTSMMFFQGLLLVGYLYSHFSLIMLGLKRQVILHLFLLLTALIVLPISVPRELAMSAAASSNPTGGLIGTLFVMVGLPFFFVSTSAPLFQKWFSAASHRDSGDPYFLYAASNIGSLCGLLSYPFLIERIATLYEQTIFWSIGYIILIIFAVTCAILLMSNISCSTNYHMKTNTIPRLIHQVSYKQRIRWIIMALVPSSLMLGLTTYITTDIASVPLLWIIPLCLYLISFIIAFSKRGIKPPLFIGRIMAIASIGIIVAIILGASQPEILFIPFHTILFFIIAIILHGKLAQERPRVKFLTEYYLWISLGGLCGGIFNALLAPIIFSTILEYPLMIAFATAFIPAGKEVIGNKTISFSRACLLIIFILFLGVFIPAYTKVSPPYYLIIVSIGISAVLAYTQVNKPVKFAFTLLVITIIGSSFGRIEQPPIFISRNFYGTLTVIDNPEQTVRSLIDGNTVHGREILSTEQPVPTSYYHRKGPLGSLFDSYHRSSRETYDTSRVAVIGLGIGTMIAYGEPHEEWDLFEINPDVVSVAKNPLLFSFLSKSNVRSFDIIIGDGRLMLNEKPDANYDIIILDAFSSGSIPVHLLTLEAIESYMKKLSPRGVIAFHISNRLFSLEPILANAASYMGLSGYYVFDTNIPEKDRLKGRDASLWVMLASNPELLNYLEETNGARMLQKNANVAQWTDNFSDIVTPLMLRKIKDNKSLQRTYGND